MKTAVIYLRVSTKEQAERDADPEGYSIPAQREACQRKAVQLGAAVIEEYVDRGESAKTADRPALRQMLERLQTKDIDYLIVHKVDRLARSRADDVTIGIALKAADAQLVSVTENIDDTPSGKLLHGIMASIAEFYSQNLATEILKGSVQKAKAGGTPHLAPLGYLNARLVIDGRDVRTITLDPERAPLVRWAFEAYATGDWSLRDLLEELSDRGLTNRAGPNRAERPLKLSRFNKLLRDAYYMGVVTYRGVEYLGRHEPLISPELFDRVQQVLDGHNQAGEKRRVHHHYLKGSVFCGRCGSRLSVCEFTGNGGRYRYFFCLGRHTRRSGCDLPYLKLEEIEEAVVAHWRCRVVLDEATVELVRTNLLTDLRAQQEEAGKLLRDAQHRIDQIERRRQRWAEKVVDGSVPDDIGRQKQNELTRQLVRANHELAELQAVTSDVECTLSGALDLVRDCATAYQQADPNLRRQWNQAFFDRLEVDVDRVAKAELTPPFKALLGRDVVGRYQKAATLDTTERNEAPDWDLGRESSERVLVGVGLSNDPLVELIALLSNPAISPEWDELVQMAKAGALF